MILHVIPGKKIGFIFLTVLFSLLMFFSTAFSTDYYVSIGRGKGKKATKEKPAKDFGNIIKKLAAGDTIHIAQGTYMGRGKNGHYKIEVPVKIIGGYDDAFSKRDPWGAHKTIFSGINKGNDNFDGKARLLIELHMKYSVYQKDEKNNVLVDGIIVDNGERNRYATEKQLKIERNASPSQGLHATPGNPGIKITAGKYCDITVQNCVVMNCAPASADGALSVSGSKMSAIVIRNNLIINNTGNGIYALTLWKPPTRTPDKKQLATFNIENNTVLFSWKVGPIDDFGGCGLKVDDYTVVTATGNVFAFSDIFGINNVSKATSFSIVNNLITANRKADYKEWNTTMNIDDIEDEAEFLEDDTEENIGDKISIPVPSEWSVMYAKRKVISRASIAGSVKANNSGINDVRSMLGLPLEAGDIKDDTNIWLNRIDLEGAMAAGMKPYKEKYGCKKP